MGMSNPFRVPSASELRLAALQDIQIPAHLRNQDSALVRLIPDGMTVTAELRAAVESATGRSLDGRWRTPDRSRTYLRRWAHRADKMFAASDARIGTALRQDFGTHESATR